MLSFNPNPRSFSLQTLRALPAKELVIYVTLAAGSAWLLLKLLRAVAHYAFPSKFPGETNAALLASPRPHSSEHASAKDLENVQEYDYIIVGTGTAGCVIANRLTEDPSITVLAIESGHSDLKQLFSRIPAAFAQLFSSGADWDITTEPQQHANGRKMYWPRGKMLGGCSAINAMIYNKGAPADYDEWESLGLKGWGYKDVKPYLTKAENLSMKARMKLPKEDLAHHGTTGPWEIGYTHSTDSAVTFLDACEQVGIEKVTDLNTDKGMVGVSTFQTFIDTKGQRSSTAVAYLNAEVAGRSNLKIAVGQSVTRIILDQSGAQPRAIGVEMAASQHAPIRYLAKAKREVILCAGAVHTPHILKFSGLGPAAELESHGIKVIKDISAVGANLVDHLFTALVSRVNERHSVQHITDKMASIPALIEWFRYGTGVMTSNVAEAAAFIRMADREDAPEHLRKKDTTSGPGSADIELMCGVAAYINHGKTLPPKDDYFSLGPVLLRPESHGTVTLASPNPFDAPLVDANYLSSQHDVDALVYGLQLSRSILKTKAFQKHFVDWYYPSRNVDDITQEELVAHVRATAETLYHPMCSARMGVDARDSVVDAELKVHGVAGLRVADASVFPRAMACHPCAPVVMVGEKAADLIKADQ